MKKKSRKKSKPSPEAATTAAQQPPTANAHKMRVLKKPLFRGSVKSASSSSPVSSPVCTNTLSQSPACSRPYSIFKSRNSGGGTAEAKYSIQSNQLQYKVEFQNQMKILNKAYLDFTASQKKFEVSKSLLYSNQINYDTEKLKYEAGRIALQELNTSKSNLVSSISSNVKEKYEMFFNSLVLKIYDGSFLK